VSDPPDWDKDLKIGGTLETGPEIVFAPRVKLRRPRVSFLVECGPIERGLDNSGLPSSTYSASRPGPSSSPPAASCSARPVQKIPQITWKLTEKPIWPSLTLALARHNLESIVYDSGHGLQFERVGWSKEGSNCGGSVVMSRRSSARAGRGEGAGMT
jgi:hypothetical protein